MFLEKPSNVKISIRKISGKEMKGRRGHSDETRRRLSEVNKGKKLSLETKRKMSEAHKGKHHSDKTKRKISKSNARYWRGKHRSLETRKKMSEAHKGKHHSEETRRKISEAKKTSFEIQRDMKPVFISIWRSTWLRLKNYGSERDSLDKKINKLIERGGGRNRTTARV